MARTINPERVNDIGDVQRYYIAFAALSGVVFFATIPFTVQTFKKTHKEKNRAREFVPWMKASFLAFTLAICLLFICDVVDAVEFNILETSISSRRANAHILSLGSLFYTVSAGTILAYLVILSPSMDYAIHCVDGRFNMALRILGMCLAGVLAALAMAIYVLDMDLYVNMSIDGIIGYWVDDSEAMYRLKTIDNIGGAIAAFRFAASLFITGLTLHTYSKHRTSPLKNASTIYLVSSLLNLLSSTWTFASNVRWNFMGISSKGTYWRYVLTIILDRWSRAAQLIITYFVAKRTQPQGGIWSNIGNNGFASPNFP